MAFWKESMINRLSNLINRNRSAAKISQVLCSSLQGIAGGTFLYITFFEVSSIFVFLIVDMEKEKAHFLADELTGTNSLSQVLPSELNVPENRLLKVFPGNKIKGLTQAAPFNQCPFQ